MQIKASELKVGDRFVFMLDLSNRKPKIVDSIGTTVKYYEASDTSKYKKLKQIKDLRESVFILNK